MSKSPEKKSTFFPKYFQQNFFKKYRFLKNIRYIFKFWRFFRSFWLRIYLFRSNNKAGNELFPTSCWIHEKLWKSCQLYILRPPLRPNHDPQSKFFCHMVLNYFLGKVPNAQYCSSKIKSVRTKHRRGGGAFKAPPPPDRIGLNKLMYLTKKNTLYIFSDSLNVELITTAVTAR